MYFSLNLLKQFRFQSIFFKYWKKFTFIIVLPFFLLNTMIYISYKQMADDKIYTTFTRSVSVNYDTIARFFDSMDQTFTMLSENHIIYDYFALNNVQMPFNHSSILTIMGSYLAQNPAIYSIYLYKTSLPYVLSTSGGNDLTKFRHLNWYEKFKTTGISNFVISGSLNEPSTPNGTDCLTVCYGVYHQKTLRGLIVLNCSLKTIDNMFPSPNDECYYLLDNEEQIFYSNNRENIGKSIPDTYHFPPATKTLSFQQGSGYITASAEFMTKPITLSVSTPLDTFTQALRLRILLVITILITILLPTLLALYISFSFYRSIREIIVGLDAFGSPSPSQSATDEINFITQQIASLSYKNQNIEKELASKIAQLQKTQLSAMQLQFNQHFLYNTLNLISMLARHEAKGKNPISTAITLLSDLLRISLDITQSIVPIRSEIAYAQKYVDIEQLKYENAFTVIWDIDKNIYDYKILKLCFQPIIENAISHALQPLPNDCEKRLLISGKIINNEIVFHFIDNGVGFDKEILKEMQDRLSSNILSQSKHIGLMSVHHRMQLLFGDKYGVSIASSKLTGSDICLRFPAILDISQTKPKT